jgi:hypothetical protein
VDEYSATVDIQYQDGEIDQCDLETWSQMAVTSCDPPEDWQSLFDLEEDQCLFVDGVLVNADPRSAKEPDQQFNWQFGWDEF